VHLIVVEFTKTALVSPNLPNLHLMAERAPGRAVASSGSAANSCEFRVNGVRGIGSKNSESSAAVTYTSVIRPTSTSTGSAVATSGYS